MELINHYWQSLSQILYPFIPGVLIYMYLHMFGGWFVFIFVGNFLFDWVFLLQVFWLLVVVFVGFCFVLSSLVLSRV